MTLVTCPLLAKIRGARTDKARPSVDEQLRAGVVNDEPSFDRIVVMDICGVYWRDHPDVRHELMAADERTALDTYLPTYRRLTGHKTPRTGV